MDVRTGWLFAGMLLGAVIALILVVGPQSLRYEALQAKSICEATLPRNQECKIVAVPKARSEPPGGDDEHR